MICEIISSNHFERWTALLKQRLKATAHRSLNATGIQPLHG
jgi:hypothetical protein